MVGFNDRSGMGVILAVPGTFEIDLHTVHLSVCESIIKGREWHRCRCGTDFLPKIQFRRKRNGPDFPVRQILYRTYITGHDNLAHTGHTISKPDKAEAVQLFKQPGCRLPFQQNLSLGHIFRNIGRQENSVIRIAIGKLTQGKKGKIHNAALQLLKHLRFIAKLTARENQDINTPVCPGLDICGRLTGCFCPLMRRRCNQSHPVFSGRQSLPV